MWNIPRLSPIGGKRWLATPSIRAGPNSCRWLMNHQFQRLAPLSLIPLIYPFPLKKSKYKIINRSISFKVKWYKKMALNFNWINLLTSRSGGEIATLFDNPWQTLQKVFWVQLDPTKRWPPNAWRWRWIPRSFSVNFAAERFDRSCCARQQKCRALQELQHRTSWSKQQPKLQGVRVLERTELSREFHAVKSNIKAIKWKMKKKINQFGISEKWHPSCCWLMTRPDKDTSINNKTVSDEKNSVFRSGLNSLFSLQIISIKKINVLKQRVPP